MPSPAAGALTQGTGHQSSMNMCCEKACWPFDKPAQFESKFGCIVSCTPPATSIQGLT